MTGIYIDDNPSNNREYLQGTLQYPLDSGKKYQVKYYVSSGANMGCNYLGAYFSPIQINEPAPFVGLLNFTPQVESSSDVIIDTSGWVEISGEFIAQGNEQYIIIGAFRDYLAMQFDTIEYNPLGGYAAYYYIDDVSVELVPDSVPYVPSQILLYPNPGQDLFNLEYILPPEISTATLEIFAMDGQLVYSQILPNTFGVFHFQPFLAAGVYGWRLRSGTEILERGKVVVN